MSDIGFASCISYPDVWMQKALNPNGFKYWEYVLIHTYDIMVILNDVRYIIEGLDKVYNLKKDPDTNNNYYEPRRQLGTNVGNFDLPDGSVTAWFRSGGDYVKDTVNTLYKKINESGSKLNGK